MKLKQHIGPALMHGKMERVMVVPVEDVLPFVVKDKRDEGAERNYGGHMVKMWSLRYQIFQKSLVCCNCGIKGEYFALEKPEADPGTRYHFNLYARLDSGAEVLITKDHVVPKSKGGTDSVNNMRTMCKVCNEMRSNRDDLIKPSLSVTS